VLYFVHAEHSKDELVSVKERFEKLKNTNDPAGWEKLEESQYLWTAMMISKDEGFLETIWRES